jgi:hypothetical protein
MVIYVAVPIGDEVVLTRGGTFSYYEFVQPMSDRLTDESWQEMLEEGNAPPMPSWVGSFVVEAESPLGFLMATTTEDQEERFDIKKWACR